MVEIARAPTSLQRVMNATDPASLGVLDQWNQQLAEIAIGLQQQLVGLLAHQKPGYTQSPLPRLPAGQISASHVDITHVDILQLIPRSVCRSDAIYGIRRVYTLDCSRNKRCSLKGHLQKFDINKSMIINSHPVSTRIDEFFIESSYAETFIQKMIDGKAASSIGIDPASIICREVRQSGQKPSSSYYCGMLQSAYLVIKNASHTRALEYIAAYTKEIGVGIPVHEK
ncbi:hypothetical protein DL89DRAFT_166382 [Linderina pennispora]|uniref:Uncharacterized protein n=1 Tax=Linderina pennispora TaxID=61395 RepID=A0A1Y1VTT6_9FUNG|nr:uncharacterized protein DL89DRAFT_166382 [Linderina pennispora]ORX64709.1 hypothetical protein DL89DRAFT_166382 [Linderina pennispora]